MTTYGNDTNPVLFTVGFIIALLLIAGAFISATTEARHEQEAELKAYQEKGCVIYQEYKIENVPAKCRKEFNYDR